MEIQIRIFTVIIFLLVLLPVQVFSNEGMYVIPVVNKGALAPVHKTGQVRCTSLNGSDWEWSTNCDNAIPPGQDGEVQPGMDWPNPRFTNNGNGTVSDNLTGLIWLRDAKCNIFFSGDATVSNQRPWLEALNAVHLLGHGFCTLSDGSQAGDWRLPTINEMLSIVHRDYVTPALSNAAGTAQWSNGNAFIDVDFAYFYWSSTSIGLDRSSGYAWTVLLNHGHSWSTDKSIAHCVWPVRDEQ